MDAIATATPTLSKPFEDEAKRAVGTALLFRVSRGGGSHGHGMDERRANDLAAEHLDGDALYELLLDVARRAAADADREAAWARSRIIDEARKVAVRSDSLSLHRFVEKYAAESRAQ